MSAEGMEGAPGGQRRELNLQQMASQFMAGMQRHFDILAFNLAARTSTDEAKYIACSNRLGAMPVPQLHQNFEQMQAHVRDLLTRQVLNDALNLAGACLNNVHLFLAVIRAHHDHAGENEVINAEVQAAQKQFTTAPFDKRFDLLEKRYKIMCPLEDSLISMGFCLQALVQQGGVVRKAQVDDAGVLRLEYLQGGSGEGLRGIHDRSLLSEGEKVWKEGAVVHFSEEELQALLLTVAAFADDLFRAVAKYAAEHGPQGAGDAA